MHAGLELIISPPLQKTQVYFTEHSLKDVLDHIQTYFEAYDHILIVIDSGLKVIYETAFLKKFQCSKNTILFIDLEEVNKSLKSCHILYQHLLDIQATKRTLLVGIGGGVLTDLIGFVAATYKRGIECAFVPTTLIGMVDSCLGGKNGFNLAEAKNIIGLIYQPRFIWINTCFLDTLPASHIKSGLGEIIKYGLIGADTILELLTAGIPSNYTHNQWLKLIQLCLEFKAKVVQKDPHDQKLAHGRGILNFGHTFGHAIEQVTQFEVYTHGEAVGIGMYMACLISFDQGHLRESELKRAEQLISKQGLGIQLKQPLHIEALLKAMRQDKKQINNKTYTCLGLSTIGHVIHLQIHDISIIQKAWKTIGGI